MISDKCLLYKTEDGALLIHSGNSTESEVDDNGIESSV